jgi:uncharacterized membrane protein YjjB (DUF3815 family)
VTDSDIIVVPETPGATDAPEAVDRPPAVRRPSGATRAPESGPSRGVRSGQGRRSLTVPAAVLCAVTFTLLGAGIDVLLGRGLGVPFAIGFVAGSALAAARVRRGDLLAGPVVPPLAFVAVVAAVAPLLPGNTGYWLTDVVVQVGTALVLDAPVLLIGTALAAGIALARRLLQSLRVSPPASRP